MAKRARPKKDAKREHRITYEVVVDCYGQKEQAMGWYYYLEGKMVFPFEAECIAERAVSPLQKDDLVEVVGVAPESECQHEMFVAIRLERRTLAVPLSQLKPINATEPETKEAIADWHYWVGQGYEL